MDTEVRLEAKAIVLSIVLAAVISAEPEKAHKIVRKSVELLPEFIWGMGPDKGDAALLKAIDEEMKAFWSRCV